MSEFEHVSRATLDRMVDGELSETEQHALLSRLDETHDGWRQLALSFVEARTWGAELRLLTEPSGDTARLEVKAASRKSGDPRSPGWLTVVLTASVMLVAGLLAGIEIGTGSSGNSVSGSSSGETVAAETPLQNQNKNEDSPGRNGNGFPITPVELKPETEFLEFVLNGEPGQAQSVSIPIRSGGNPDSLLEASEPTLSRGLQDFLHEHGHEFVEHRDLISVELPDGREAVIPVRQVQLRHMMNRFGQ